MFQYQLDYHTHKFVLISLRLCFGVKEKFSTPKNVISKGAYLNDCWIQLASQMSLFAKSHINFAT